MAGLRFPLSNASAASSRSPPHSSGPGWLAAPFPYDSFIRNSLPVYPGAFAYPLFLARWRVDQLRGENLQLAADVKESQRWQMSKQGAFETGFGSLAKVGQRSFHIPFISMTAGDEHEFRLRHGDPASAERIAGQLRLSLQSWRDGKCDGVVIYCLDKGPRSTTFPLVRKAFHEYGGSEAR
jgi:hypothetical protein